jgi:hypothetical protein
MFAPELISVGLKVLFMLTQKFYDKWKDVALRKHPGVFTLLTYKVV